MSLNELYAIAARAHRSAAIRSSRAAAGLRAVSRRRRSPFAGRHRQGAPAARLRADVRRARGPRESLPWYDTPRTPLRRFRGCAVPWSRAERSRCATRRRPRRAPLAVRDPAGGGYRAGAASGERRDRHAARSALLRSSTARAFARIRRRPPSSTARPRATATPRRSTASAGCTPTAAACRATTRSPRRSSRWRRDCRTRVRASACSRVVGEARGELPGLHEGAAKRRRRCFAIAGASPIRSSRCRRSSRRSPTSVMQRRAALRHRAAARARGDRRRIELRADRALGQGRARVDAAHSRYGRALQRSRSRTTSTRTSAAGSRTCAGCSRTTRARSRSPPRPTMPARRRSTGIAAFRRTPRHATM